jgi:PadR family transcriptional regulator, regulatory protein PadR
LILIDAPAFLKKITALPSKQILIPNSIYRNSIIPNGESGQQRYIYLVLKQRELFFGLIRIHVLVHASHEPIFGLAMMEELAHHGYRIGPGTLYPLLHGLERGGLLKSVLKNVGSRRRRVYKITSAGKKALGKAISKVDELHHELHEEHPRKISPLDT